MRKKLSLLLIPFLLPACSDEEEYRFVAEEKERVITETLAGPRFSTGDTIGVYPVGYRNGQPGIPGDIAYPVNIPLYYDGAQWNPEDEDYLFTGEEILDIYAYFPYDPELGSVEGKLDITQYKVDLSVQQPQEAIDLLWVKKTVNTGSGNVADLVFRHLFSKIKLRLTMKDVTDSNVRLEIHNLYTSSIVNLADGSVVHGTSVNLLADVPVTEQSGSMIVYEAIVPPQVIAADTPLFLIYIDDRQTLYTIDRFLELQQGMNYTFDLTVSIASGV